MEDQTGTPAQSNEPGGGTVRDAVEAAFKEHGAPVEDAPFSLDPPQEDETKETKERPRDQAGKFAKSDAPKEAAQEEVKNTDQDDSAKVIEEASKSSIEPPVSWSADAKADWAKLPPVIQQAVIKREQEISNGGRQWSEEKRRFEDLLEPVRQAASRYGIDEREGLQRLVAAQNALDRDPVNGIKQIAQSYGVDLTTMSTNPDHRVVDPMLSTLSQRLESIEQTVQQERMQSAIQTVESFKSTKDASGNPAYPHFEDVKVEMGKLIDSGEAKTLAEAYEAAIWRNQSVREKLLAERESKFTPRQSEEAKVAKAKSAAVSLKGSGSATPIPNQKKFDSVRSAVEDAWRQHAG